MNGKSRDHYLYRTSPEILDGIADRMAASMPVSRSRVKLIVTIPAHNEAETLPNCLESINNQFTSFGTKLPKGIFSVIVLCHNCSDDTEKVCSEFKSTKAIFDLTILETNNQKVNNVGAVRRILLRIARSQISEDGYIAMTDADTKVDKRWVSNLLGYIESGYGLICGRINYDDSEVSEGISKVLELKRRFERLQILLENRIHPDNFEPMPRHLDNSGPNMAVRADAHDAVGGLDPIGFCEDVAFYDAVVKGGYKVRHCPRTVVTTSCRIGPRAPWGFGAELGTWNTSDADLPKVEGVGALSARYLINRMACEYIRSNCQKTFDTLVICSGIKETILRNYLVRYTSARAVCLCIEKKLDELVSWRIRYPLKSIDCACAEVKVFLEEPSADFLQTSKR